MCIFDHARAKREGREREGGKLGKEELCSPNKEGLLQWNLEDPTWGFMGNAAWEFVCSDFLMWLCFMMLGNRPVSFFLCCDFTALGSLALRCCNP